MNDGTLHTAGGRSVLRFERALRHSPEKVWPALTDPAELAHWFPARVEVDLRPGGRMRFIFPGEEFEAAGASGRITEFEPPRLIAWKWDVEAYSFELTAEGDACVLVFTHAFDTPAEAAKFAAGWHLCLDGLQARLDGAPAPSPDGWGGHHERYVRSFAGAGK